MLDEDESSLPDSGLLEGEELPDDDQAGIPDGGAGLLRRIFRFEKMIAVGITVTMDDVTVEEMDGLIILDEERAKVARGHRQTPAR